MLTSLVQPIRGKRVIYSVPTNIEKNQLFLSSQTVKFVQRFSLKAITIISLLYNKTFQVRISNTYSDIKVLQKRIHQGSCLSTLLSTIMIND